MRTPYKICPRCRQTAPLAATRCAACGHIYRTQSVPNGHTDGARCESGTIMYCRSCGKEMNEDPNGYYTGRN